ncbi:MAG: ribonuclease III [Vampirovibrionales bacterium]
MTSSSLNHPQDAPQTMPPHTHEGFTPQQAGYEPFEALLRPKLLAFGLPIPQTPTQWQRIQDAFTHPSYRYEKGLYDPTLPDPYERLEFLGDAILKWTLSDLLFETFPHYNEGQMTKIRSVIVSDKQLATIAHTLAFGTFMYLGVSELKAHGRQKASNLACVLEAFLGAMYLNVKYHPEHLKQLIQWIHSLWEPYLHQADASSTKNNYKAVLQEWTQGQGLGLPEYLLETEEGPSHKRTFTMSVWIQGSRHGTGQGVSKKEAQQYAAKEALLRLQVNIT